MNSINRHDDGPLRVLQVCRSMDAGGIEAFLMSVYRALDRDEIQFDFLEALTKPCFYDDEIREMGGRVYKVPYSRKKPIKARNNLHAFFDRHSEYSIVHFHMGSLDSNLLALKMAKLHGVQTRVLHAHSSFVTTNSPVRQMIHSLNSLRAPSLATDFFACSAAAASYFGFEKNQELDWRFIPNGIEIPKFAFSTEARLSCRKSLGYDDEILCLGMVGRYEAQKNHLFALDVFKRLHESVPTARLLVVGGSGTLEEVTAKRVHDLELDDFVTLLKDRHDVNCLYSAMDAFLFPSLFEGLGIALVEAQANGLPCVVSDAIPEEGLICPNTKVLPLGAGTAAWVEALKLALLQGHSADGPSQVESANFSIDAVAQDLGNFYLSRARRE